MKAQRFKKKSRLFSVSRTFCWTQPINAVKNISYLITGQACQEKKSVIPCVAKGRRFPPSSLRGLEARALLGTRLFIGLNPVNTINNQNKLVENFHTLSSYSTARTCRFCNPNFAKTGYFLTFFLCKLVLYKRSTTIFRTDNSPRIILP